MEKEILGYVVCRTCLTAKAIMQGSGKRAAFVHGRCECGPDNRTGKPAQIEMKAFKPLDEVDAEIEAMKQPKPEPKPEPQSEPKPIVNKPEQITNPDSESDGVGTMACVGIGAVCGLAFGGLVKALKMVA
ncbi:TPA: hypothetical protein ACVO35_004160 [Vibrio alginolyticus]|uniref:hypothetical protein n=1 Tax=Vibrio alginolyticus TaxID=663 RepID=UPI0007A9FF2B|nr:hypothetical protein [Vibrio alginolyticus]KZC46068.1 hypothetical protein XM68_c12668 [Vibrio alginolyticus]